nr:exonuclease domain-containing protein [Arsenicicoccus dermatophilus]
MWVGVVIGGVVGLLFLLVGVLLLRDGEVGAAVFGLVVAAGPLCLAALCLRWLNRHRGEPVRRGTVGPAPTPSTPRSAAQPTPAQPTPSPRPSAAPAPGRTPVIPAPAPAPAPARVRRVEPPLPPRTSRPRFRRGAPGIEFGYAEHGGPREHSGPFAIVDVETTGFAADQDDRVIEVAVARVDATGRIEDEWATLVNPRRDTGPVFIHHITDEAVAGAPTFEEIADELLARLEGAVVVAHNASFDERFLRAELARAGYAGLRAPALCSLWLSRRTLDTPNHKLGTLGRHYGCAAVDAHSALGDVRTVARLLPIMLDRHGETLTFPFDPYVHTPSGGGSTRVVTRAATLRKGEVGWMSTLLDRLPLTANDITDDVAARYLDALSAAMEDGRIVGEEAKLLARIAGQGGLGAGQVRALNERFLEGLREAAFEDDVLTRDELRALTRAADALGATGYFADLTPSSPSPSLDDTRASEPAGPAAPVVAPAPAERKVRRCGYCRQPGHYRPRCPELASGEVAG